VVIDGNEKALFLRDRAGSWWFDDLTEAKPSPNYYPIFTGGSVDGVSLEHSVTQREWQEMQSNWFWLRKSSWFNWIVQKENLMNVTHSLVSHLGLAYSANLSA